MKHNVKSTIKFTIGTIVILLSIIVNFTPSMAGTLSPFGNFEWSDNVIDVFQKLKKIPSIKEIRFSGIDDLENNNANQIQISDSILLSSIRKNIKAKSKGWMFDEYNHQLLLKNGTKSLYFSRPCVISAGPINLAGIPYKVIFEFVAVPGYILTNEEKAIKTDVDGREVMFIHQFSEITFIAMDSALAEANHQELFDILHKKYPEIKDTFGTLWDGKPQYGHKAFFCDGDYAIGVDITPDKPKIFYRNSFNSVEELYTKHRNSILTNELKSKDSSSGL